jgi:protein-L-isoaspartate(D-aspartate) O-methyltransferase
MVAVMTEALGISPGDRILEIGTGSGYQTAVLCRLAWRVFTVERIPELKDQAQAALDALGISNVAFLQGDGSQGWPEQAPFDAILVTAGAPQIPEALKDQLVDTGGTLVIPVGDRWVQKLLRVTREGTSFVQEELLACRFVPLVGAGGWETPEPL